mgnify:CR=1 FL=1
MDGWMDGRDNPGKGSDNNPIIILHSVAPHSLIVHPTSTPTLSPATPTPTTSPTGFLMHPLHHL